MAKQLRSLTGKVAVVTGGGRGIGERSPSRSTAKGVRVAIGDVDRAAAEHTAAELGDAVVGLPSTSPTGAGFTAFLDDVEGRLGPIDSSSTTPGSCRSTPFERGVGRDASASSRSTCTPSSTAPRRRCAA